MRFLSARGRSAGGDGTASCKRRLLQAPEGLLAGMRLPCDDGGMITTKIDPKDGTMPEGILYMPAGQHRVCGTVNGRPGARTVLVDAAAAARLQEALQARLELYRRGEAVRPCGLFDHRPGAASFLARAFEWDPARGVVLRVEWASAGREAIQGRHYSYFSPRFLLDEQGRVAGLTEEAEVGSLVNDPAFERAEQIAASRDYQAPRESLAEGERLCDDAGMDQIKTLLGLPPDADDAAVAAKIQQLMAQADDDKKDIAAKAADAEKARRESCEARADADAAKDELKKKDEELSALRARLDKDRDAAADVFVEMACSSGKIAPKDEAAKAAWKEIYKTSPDTARKAMEATPVNPALEQMTAGKVPTPAAKSLREMCQEEIDAIGK